MELSRAVEDLRVDLEAEPAAREAGAEVVGVATVVDRETGAGDVIAAEGLEYRSLLGLGDLDLA